MSTFSGKLGLAIVVAVLGLGQPAAQAQSEPVRYWIPFGPFGFGGGTAETTTMDTYSDVPASNSPASSFGSDGQSGFVFRNEVIPINALTSGFVLNGPRGATAFSSLDSLSYERSRFGYNFKGVGDLPMTVFGGVDILKHNPDVFSAVTSFGPNAGTAAAYGVHAGIEVRPTSNISLSFSAGFTQQQTGTADGGDLASSLLPRELGGRR